MEVADKNSALEAPVEPLGIHPTLHTVADLFSHEAGTAEESTIELSIDRKSPWRTR